MTDDRVFDGRWRLGPYLDSGGMGVVYRGYDLRLGNEVAIKLMSRDFAARDPSAAARFQDEARAMAKVSHPNVVRVHDCSTTPNGELYMVMQLVEGANLEKVTSRLPHRPDLAAVAEVIDQLSAGLHAVHERGLVHRDVKPQNALIEPARLDGHVYLGDFGVSKSLDRSHSGYVVGTSDYMSPEACRGLRVDRRSDVYSLGCVVFECLTGTRWHQRERQAIPEQAGPRLARLRPDLPAAVADVLECALAEDPRDRYATAPRLAADLQRARHARVHRHQSGTLPVQPPMPRPVRPPVPRPAPQPALHPALMPRPTRVTEPLPEPRQRPALVVLKVAVVALLLLGGGVIAVRSMTSPEPNEPSSGVNAIGGPSGEATAGGSAAGPDDRGEPVRPLSDADRASQARLSAGYGDCTSETLTERLTSFLDCTTTPGDLSSLQVRQFTSRAEMDAAFRERYVDRPDRFRAGACSVWAENPLPPGRGHISSWDGGGLACFVNENKHAVVLWQVDELALQLVAIRSDDDAAAVFAWWQQYHDGVLR